MKYFALKRYGFFFFNIVLAVLALFGLCGSNFVDIRGPALSAIVCRYTPRGAKTYIYQDQAHKYQKMITRYSPLVACRQLWLSCTVCRYYPRLDNTAKLVWVVSRPFYKLHILAKDC